jgi:hypothetical protein
VITELGGPVSGFTHDLISDLFSAKNAGVTLLHQRPDMNGKKERLCYGDDGSTEQVNITRG